MRVIEDIVGIVSDKIRCAECHIKHWFVRADGPGWKMLTARHKESSVPCESCDRVIKSVKAFSVDSVLAASKDGKLWRLCLIQSDKPVQFSIETIPNNVLTSLDILADCSKRTEYRTMKLEIN